MLQSLLFSMRTLLFLLQTMFETVLCFAFSLIRAKLFQILWGYILLSCFFVTGFVTPHVSQKCYGSRCWCGRQWFAFILMRFPKVSTCDANVVMVHVVQCFGLLSLFSIFLIEFSMPCGDLIFWISNLHSVAFWVLRAFNCWMFCFVML